MSPEGSHRTLDLKLAYANRLSVRLVRQWTPSQDGISAGLLKNGIEPRIELDLETLEIEIPRRTNKRMNFPDSMMKI